MAPSPVNVTTVIDAVGDEKGWRSEDRGGQSGGKKHKPERMEIKYNLSFRNAVISRQVYSNNREGRGDTTTDVCCFDNGALLLF